MVRLLIAMFFCSFLGLGGSCEDPTQPASDTAQPPSLEVLADGTARVAGVVVSNHRLCEMDAQCWLVLAIGEVEATVVYHEGEGGSCFNEAAIKAGLAAEPLTIRSSWC